MTETLVSGETKEEKTSAGRKNSQVEATFYICNAFTILTNQDKIFIFISGEIYNRTFCV